MNYYYACPPEGEPYCIGSSAMRYGTITLDLSAVTGVQLLGTTVIVALLNGVTLVHTLEDGSHESIYNAISSDMMMRFLEQSK